MRKLFERTSQHLLQIPRPVPIYLYCFTTIVFNEENFTLDLDFAEVLHKISYSEGGMKEAIEEFKFEENLWHLSSKYHDYNPFECMNGIGVSNNQS